MFNNISHLLLYDNSATDFMEKVEHHLSLRYISDQTSGLTRVKRGSGFAYLDTGGNLIRNEQAKTRIKALAIPPAWSNVWISPFVNGHLQATGRDEKGRKQYLYHPDWNALRKETKFARILTFGMQLPKLRRAIRKDLRKQKLTKAKVTAIALTVMENTLIRPGNVQYRENYHSFGLTTLQQHHIAIGGQQIFFHFVGKKGKEQRINISDKSLANRLKKVIEIPGQELFQYYNDDGEISTLDSADLNDYIKQYAGKAFTSKDFRTWFGTVWAFRYLAELDDFQSKAICKQHINECLDFVAKKLGNTRAICRQYYVSHELIRSYENGQLKPYIIKAMRSKNRKKEPYVQEKYLIQFLAMMREVH